MRHRPGHLPGPRPARLPRRPRRGRTPRRPPLRPRRPLGPPRPAAHPVRPDDRRPGGRLTAEAAAEVIERLADAAGLSGAWSGHSPRRGFATAARAAGHDSLEIARAGGWADGSRVLARYMDDVDRVNKPPGRHRPVTRTGPRGVRLNMTLVSRTARTGCRRAAPGGTVLFGGQAGTPAPPRTASR
ncbi:tyrosine-type recombinase/integrase [Streptomyces sp. NPDC007355]|uniref:tyrosine-type recombinase/integrase n=1 Tax=Streptomyces sp. NPDC007355 TaxID=3364778 RepID=UPI0036BC1E37